MPLLVLAATGLELDAALGREHGARQGEVFAADAYGTPVLALVTGIGVVNAAFCLGAALAGAGDVGDVTGVVDFGVAGSFDCAAHPVGSVRLVEAETWPEYGLLRSGASCADAAGLGFPLGSAEGREVRERLAWDAEAALGRMGLARGGWERSASVTVSGVTADRERAGQLFSRFGAGLENMEGFALAYGSARAGLPFAELRAVSNPVGARPPQGWDLGGACAALGRAAKRLFSGPRA